MNKAQSLGVFLSIVGFIAVIGTGVDLVTSRTGMGLGFLGLGGLLVALATFRKSPDGRSLVLPVLICLGSGYFIWRAFSGGPIGLALPDVVLVLIAVTTYLAVLACGRGGRIALIVALGAVCFANVGMALAQEFGDEAFFVWEDSLDRKKVVTGVFGHYNPLAGFLNGSVFFFLSYLLLGKKLAWRIVSGVLVCGILAALVFCGSRGGWLSFIAGGAIWLSVVLTYLKQRQSKYFGMTLIAGVALGVIAIVSAQWRLQKLTNERQVRPVETLGAEADTRIDDGGRLEFQQLAFEIFQDHPVIGGGPRAYSYLSLDYWDKDRRSLRERPPVYAHNEYLQALADYGALGLFILVGLILVHVVLGVYAAVTSRDEEKDLAIWQIGAVGGMISILGQCFFSFLLHVPACVVLLALQVGFLASGRIRKAEHAPSEFGRIFAGLRASFGLCVSVVTLIFGVILAQSYLLSAKASRQFTSITDEQSAFAALETMKLAGDLGRDPEIFEVMGRKAMSFANNAFERNDPEQAKKFNLVAKSAFESALSYHPNFPAGIAGLPRVEDALGNPEAAELGHQRAMKELWAREFRLRPHLYAAHSSRRSAFQELYSGDKLRSLTYFREAHKRLLTRRELLVGASWEVKEDKALRFEVEAWIAFLEAGRLFKEGDRVWKDARPRNPELAYALLLEAEKRYEASGGIVRKVDPSWEKQIKQLRVNLGYLKSGRVVPAKLSEEKIAEITSSEEVLDSESTTR